MNGEPDSSRDLLQLPSIDFRNGNFQAGNSRQMSRRESFNGSARLAKKNTEHKLNLMINATSLRQIYKQKKQKQSRRKEIWSLNMNELV